MTDPQRMGQQKLELRSVLAKHFRHRGLHLVPPVYRLAVPVQRARVLYIRNQKGKAVVQRESLKGPTTRMESARRKGDASEWWCPTNFFCVDGSRNARVDGKEGVRHYNVVLT